MLGDWNNGPDGLHVTAEFKDNYDLLRHDGWWDGLAESGDPFCTWCEFNTNFVEDGTPEANLDHIFVKNAG